MRGMRETSGIRGVGDGLLVSNNDSSVVFPTFAGGD